MKTYSYINEQTIVQLIKIKNKNKNVLHKNDSMLVPSQLFGQDNIPQFCK